MSEGWFLIAEFARRCRLPVSALRYYDRVGLLRPAHVDPVSGYRRYRADQLADAVTIARLRAVGTSPDVIARVLEGGATRVRALASERRRLEREIHRLTDALSGLEDVAAPEVADPQPSLREPEDVVAWPFTAPAAALSGTIRRGVATLRSRLRRQARTVLRWGAVLPLDLGDTVAGHVVARLDGAPPAGPDVLRLSGGDALGVVHRGPRDALAHAYAALLDAADRAGAQAVGPVVEWYPDTTRTEITVRTAGPAARPGPQAVTRSTRRG